MRKEGSSLFNNISVLAIAIGIIASLGILLAEPNLRISFSEIQKLDFKDRYDAVMDDYSAGFEYPLYLSIILLITGAGILMAAGKLREWNFLFAFISPPMITVITAYFVFGGYGHNGSMFYGGISSAVISYILFKAVQFTYRTSKPALISITSLFMGVVFLTAVFSCYKLEATWRKGYEDQALGLIEMTVREDIEKNIRAAEQLFLDAINNYPEKKELYLDRAYQLLQDSVKLMEESKFDHRHHIILASLGQVYIEQNRYQEAEACLKNERLAVNKYFGKHTGRVADVDLKLARLYYEKMGRKEEAINVAEKARDLYIKIRGLNDHKTQHAVDLISQWEEAKTE